MVCGAGYVGGTWYKMLGGTNWPTNVMLSAVLFCGPVLVVFSFLNTVAIFYRVRLGVVMGHEHGTHAVHAQHCVVGVRLYQMRTELLFRREH